MSEVTLLKSTNDAEGFPVEVDPQACHRLQRLLEKDGRASLMVRLGVKGGGCSGLEYLLRIETERAPGDLCAEMHGITFVCDRKSARFLRGSRLVYTGSLVGMPFKFENPNAGRSCGCGTSFTPKEGV